MKYNKEIILKNTKPCIIRNAAKDDAKDVLETLNKVYAETDFLSSYTDEKVFSIDEEVDFLNYKENSPVEVQLCSTVDGKVRGLASISAIGSGEKLRHRSEFGISVEKEYWNLGIGHALTKACIECAKKAGYKQLELEVVAENTSAISLYESVGFEEYGRNPRGFYSRYTGWQEHILMRLALD